MYVSAVRQGNSRLPLLSPQALALETPTSVNPSENHADHLSSYIAGRCGILANAIGAMNSNGLSNVLDRAHRTAV